MLQKITSHFFEKLRQCPNWGMIIKRIIYIGCFAGLCLIDQMIGSATGYVQYGLKNYTGIIIAIIILTAYSPKDFMKLPYFLWLIVFFSFRYFSLDWLKSIIYNDLEVETNLWGICIYGIILIRVFYLWIVEKKKIKMNWFPFSIFVIMMLGMVIIRSDLAWPPALFGACLCFYLTDFSEKDLNNLYSGIVDGIILGFFIIQGQAWLFRPYDIVRYFGMYSHANINALFYVCVYCAVLAKWYLMKLKKQSNLLRLPIILLAGLVVGTTFFTGSRTAYITIAVITVIFIGFQVISRKKRKLLECVIDVAVIAFSCLICFFPAYFLIRYVPAYVDAPLYFEGDYEREKVQKGEPVNSEKYIELEEALEEVLGRFFWFADKNTSNETALREWKNFFSPSLVVYAADDDYPFWYPEDEVYVAPGTDNKHPLMTVKKAKADPVNVRLSIYKYFIERLSLIGEKENPQGVWLTRFYFASHCHNVFLQIAYDFGIIVGLLFGVVTIMIYNNVFFGLTEKKSGSWYYRLFITIGFASILVVFGMLEMCWVYGQLSFIMFFLVQYILYHKSGNVTKEFGSDKMTDGDNVKNKAE